MAAVAAAAHDSDAFAAAFAGTPPTSALTLPPPPPRRTELHATHLCVCVILLVNAFVMSFGFVALGCYMYFYPGLGRDNAAACFRVDCFFVAIFDTVSAHTNSGLAIQTSGYATFVEQ